MWAESIELEADALDLDGTIHASSFSPTACVSAKEHATLPLSLGIAGSPERHLLTARATDDRFSTTTSIAVQVFVIEPEQVNLVAIRGRMALPRYRRLFPGDDGWKWL